MALPTKALRAHNMDIRSPRVTVLMATWNRTQTIGRAIKSVIDQSFQDWELIIVGDGSPAETESVIHKYRSGDKRIKYTRIEHVGRIAAVTNVGLRMAVGEFVAILDDDDWWIDERKLEKQLAFLDAHSDHIGCGGGFIVVDEKDKEQARILKPETNGLIQRMALSANPIANSAGIFRRVSAGSYDESMLQFADWDFWLRLGTKGKLYNFPEYFLAYRIWQQGSSFLHQRENANAALLIVNRYKHQYSGFTKAIFLARLYWCYSYLPGFIRRGMNAKLSKLKKFIFSR